MSSRLFAMSYGLISRNVVKKQCPISWNVRKANYCTTTSSNGKEALYSKMGSLRIYCALGFFTPISLWLLRDIYLEDNKKLQLPVLGGGKDVASKNMDFNREDVAIIEGKTSGIRERLAGLKQSFLDVLYHGPEDYKTQESGVLKSRASAAEATLVAKVQSAQEEADEWKSKYAVAVREANMNMQSREDALRADFAQSLKKKDREVREKAAKIEQAERRLATLTSELKTAESKVKSYYSEMSGLKYDVRKLTEKLESATAIAQSYKSEARMLEQEKNHVEQKYRSGFARFDEGQERCKAGEKEVKRATEAAEKARSEAAVAQKEKNEIQRASMERLAQIERCERQIDNLMIEKNKLAGQIDALRNLKMDANAKTRHLEAQVEEREKKIESLMKSNETERASRVEANSRAEALARQLQATQRKLDMLQQQLSSALDAKLKRVNEHAKLKID